MSQRALISVCCGAVLQVIAFLLLLTKTETSSISRTVVAYTQAPGAGALRLVNHFIVPPVTPLITVSLFTLLFLLQTLVFALPVWMLMKRFSGETM
jgi:hypothetical protein